MKYRGQTPQYQLSSDTVILTHAQSCFIVEDKQICVQDAS